MIKDNKRGAVFRMDDNNDTDEANRRLDDINNYKQLGFDPTGLHTEKM